MNGNRCRICSSELRHTFVDLGMSPLSNSYIGKECLQRKEAFYPLHAYVCANCFLVQIMEYESPESIFSEYAYFSSYSKTWIEHSKQYVEKITNRLNLDDSSSVIEIASNDGYLLQFFKERKLPVLGIEPAENVAKEAEKKGIPTIKEFFGTKLAAQLVQKEIGADLLIGNNVLAHVPDINDFVEGLKLLLKPGGVITIEFPHLLRLIQENQFDTIYHEHFSYLSLNTVRKLFENKGLAIFDVDEISTHGGSLRIYAKHNNDVEKDIGENVMKIISEEEEAGFMDVEYYTSFSKNVQKIKREILQFMINYKNEGKTMIAYGAPAKGNTLLNYCGIGTDFIDYTVDISTYKQGLFLPGTHIPIYSPDVIKETKPDYVIILPWNIKDEIIEQIKYIRAWGGRFITLIPKTEVY